MDEHLAAYIIYAIFVCTCDQINKNIFINVDIEMRAFLGKAVDRQLKTLTIVTFKSREIEKCD